MQWCGWFLVGGVLSWPLATRVGKFFQSTWGGVPVVNWARFRDTYIDQYPSRAVQKMFRRGAYGTVFASGFLLAQFMAPWDGFANREYQRPDFKPKAAMVKDTSMHWDDQANEQLKKMYKYRSDPEARKRSTLYRFFFPLDADYSVEKNPWANSDPLSSVNARDGSFPIYSNNYADHKN